MDTDAEVCLALRRALVEGVARLAEGLWVLVEGRVWVGGVGRPLFLGGEFGAGGGRRHGRVVGGRGAEWLRRRG